AQTGMPPRRRRAAPGTSSSTASAQSHQAPSVQPTASTCEALDQQTDDSNGNCAICMDTLALKRAIKLLPCYHEFHRTCAIHFLESRTNRRMQVCPLCRKRTFDVSEGNFIRKNFYFPFKDQEQPTRRFIFR
ncbi:hypothetical protein PENTCL1PPCAC_9817, partial [Pristionchus entomophagus]